MIYFCRNNYSEDYKTFKNCKETPAQIVIGTSADLLIAQRRIGNDENYSGQPAGSEINSAINYFNYEFYLS